MVGERREKLKWLNRDWFDVCRDLGDVPLVIADPPYGGIVKESWDQGDALALYMRFAKSLETVLAEGGTAYVWGGVGTYKNRVWFEFLSRVERETSLQIWDVITWAKKRAYGTKNRCLFVREELVMLTRGGPPKTFHVPLLDVKRGYEGYNKKYPAKSEFKRRTNVWGDVTEIMRGKKHPTEKPERLAEIMIETSSNPGDIVVDAFAGSGNVSTVAERLGRKAVAVEIDPMWTR
jgi:DNA modification methylase